MMFIPKLLGSPSRRESDVHSEARFDTPEASVESRGITSFELECTGVELIIRTLLRDQLLVGTALNDLAVIKDHDDV